MEKRAVVLTEGPILPGLFRLFLPIMLGALLQQCYNTIDVAIVGNCLGKEGLAAVGGTSSTMTNLMMEFLVGISSGAAVVISQYFGARKERELKEGVKTALGIGAVLGLALTIAGILAAPLLLQWIHAPKEIAGMAGIYLRTYFCGLVPMALYNTGAAILRAVGDTKGPLYVLAGCCILNLLLDLLFVMVFGWGIFGAALATVAAQTVSAGITLFLTLKKFRGIRTNPAALPRPAGEKAGMASAVPRPLRETNGMASAGRSQSSVKRMLSMGLPSGLQAVMYSVSNMVVQSQVNTFSTDVIAASSVFDRLEGFFWMFFNAFGVAVLTFMGQNYGAGKRERMRRGLQTSLGTGIVLALVLSGLSIAGGRWFFGMFTKDASVREIGLSILYFLMPWYFIYVFIEVFSGVIRSTGNALWPMGICCFGICILRMGWALFIAPACHTINFLLLGYPVSWSVTALLFFLYYRFGRPLKELREKEFSHAGCK